LLRPKGFAAEAEEMIRQRFSQSTRTYAAFSIMDYDKAKLTKAFALLQLRGNQLRVLVVVTLPDGTVPL
jgi:hypothetical protein